MSRRFAIRERCLAAVRTFNTEGPAYVDRCGAEAGHLIVFDRAPERSWEEKIFRRAPSADGVPVTVWGM